MENKIEKIESKRIESFLPIKGRDINSFKVEGIGDIEEERKMLEEEDIEDVSAVSHKLELIKNPLEIRKINCKHYNWPYSNCIIYALGDDKGDLNFRIRSESALFSLLQKEYDEVDYEQIKPGDIAVYYNKERDGNAPEGDNTYIHVGKIIDDLRVESQWGNTGVYRHPIPLVLESYGDSVVFMRKKEK